MVTLKYFLMSVRPLAEDLLSTIVFALLYDITGNLTLGILLGMTVGVSQIVFYRLTKRPIYAMQWMSLGLVLVLGTASLITGNARFAMLKPSVGMAAVASVMLIPGWQARYAPAIVRDNLSARALALWGYAWSALIFALAAANLYVALNMSYSAWVWYTTFIPLSAQFCLFLIQFTTIRAHLVRKFRTSGAPAE
ncbi:MAG TPA: septation protein IspZ [Rhizomicrobium sp.]|nr:septation protein IspZ [Rhizomicrobium sp.]